ncbi:MAG: glycosyltransferase family 39 protein, partial [Gemmatimonadota bacterium]|nr:glycosyltransferase family 39 protein [Gemmatimonadota bacterium]
MPERWWRSPVALALLAFAVLRLASLTRYPAWTDETWTMAGGNADFRRFLRWHADDQTHPPLYYLILWFWRSLAPESLSWARLLSALAGIATAVPLVALCRAAGLTSRATALAVLMGAGSGFLVAYSVEIRNYAFLALFATASLALWLRERDSHAPNLRALTFVNVLLVQSHYFGLFVVLAEWLDATLWARRRARAMTGSAAFAVATLIPWVAYTFRRAGITGRSLEVVDWIPQPIPGDALDVVRDTLGGLPWLGADLVVAVALLGVIAVWIVRARTGSGAPAVRLLALTILAPIVVALVVSVLSPRSLWVTRYFIAAAPPIIVLAAASIDWAVPKRLGAVAIGIALLPTVLTGWSLVRGTAKPRYDLAVGAVPAVSNAVLFTAPTVDVRPLEWA